MTRATGLDGGQKVERVLGVVSLHMRDKRFDLIFRMLTETEVRVR